MDQSTLDRFNSSRSFDDKAVKALCYAPHTNLFFDQKGLARACCWNSAFPVGDVTRQTLDEIWHGAKAAALRRSLERMEFAAGCGHCDRQTETGWIANPPMRIFDRMAVSAAQPEWPQSIELSISNSCNLECIMCSGIHSSAIRAHREKLPPRPRIYPDSFIESLRKYLPHLYRIKFLGGEPFLITKYHRIWDMMLADGITSRCHVTTNGTQYNKRIEKIISRIPFSFAVSLDGITKKTVESIRVGANFDEQMEILKIFRNYVQENKTDLSLTFCFMRQNWFELGEFCLFADEFGCNVGVNMVANPADCAVYNLPLEDLRRILETMECQSVELESRLTRNRGVWLNELERVRRRCEHLGREAYLRAPADAST
jgi:MoaA/NifB/PqqE/SkfB family radical SAM enzyme